MELADLLLNKKDVNFTLHSRPMIFFATSCTFADAKATAVSANISTTGEPTPFSPDLFKKLSNTMSISSGTWKSTKESPLAV